MRFTVFTWVSRGLATEHKIVYLTQIATKLMKRGELEEKFDPESFNFLIRGLCPRETKTSSQCLRLLNSMRAVHRQPGYRPGDL